MTGSFIAGDVGHDADRGDPGQVIGQEYPFAARLRPGDAAHARMPQRAAQEGDFPGAGQLDVGHVTAAAAP